MNLEELLKFVTEKGASVVTPQLRALDEDMPKLPWVDQENFNAGYLMRSMHLLPKRGDKHEWQHTQDYSIERKEIPAIDLEGSEFEYA